MSTIQSVLLATRPRPSIRTPRPDSEPAARIDLGDLLATAGMVLVLLAAFFA